MTKLGSTFRGRSGAVLFATTLFLGLHASTAAQAAAGGDPNAWQFELTPYLFASAIDGTIGVRGATADVHISFSDSLENLDSAFMGLFVARKDRWTLGIDTVYSKLVIDGTRSGQGLAGNINSAALESTTTMQIYQPFAGYRVLDERTKVDLIGGARYTQLDQKIVLNTATGAPLLPDGSRSVSDSRSWWDAVVGVQVHAPIADRWSFVGYADVGGGGSDSTYQLYAGVHWQFAKDYSAKMGYRYLAQDYKKDGFVWDASLSGVFLGLGIAF